MSLIGTRPKKHNVLRNESGQAVIEYILVLAITIFLVGTFAYQFSSAFRKYANNYFGEYIACLLETGELPGKTAGECSASYTPFNIADGKTSTGGSIGSGGLGGDGAGNSNSDGSGSNKNSSGKNSKKSSSGSGSSSGSSAGATGENVAPGGADSSGGGSGLRNKAGTRRSTSVASSTGAGGGGKGKEGLKAVGSVSSTSSSDGAGGRNRRTTMSRDFGYAGQQEDQQRAEDRPVTKAVAKNDSDHLKPPSAVENPPRAPATVADDGGGGFTFGAFLRFILIAGIIIAIVILFGGQLLAITKSGEK